MFNQEDLNKLNDYTFAFLVAEKSNRLLDKLSLQRGDNPVFNSVRTAYTIQKYLCVNSVKICASVAIKCFRQPFVIFVHHS